MCLLLLLLLNPKFIHTNTTLSQDMDEIFEKLKSQGQDTVDGVVQWMREASTMEAAFEKLKKEGKNDVDNLVKWMKDSNIIGAAKDAEEKAKKLFEGSNQKNIDFETFKTAVTKVAEEQKKNVDELMKSLAEQGPKLMEAVQAGASAFKDALTKK